MKKKRTWSVSHWPAWLLQVYIVSEIYEVPPHLNLPKKQVAWVPWTMYDALKRNVWKNFRWDNPQTFTARNAHRENRVRLAIPGAADCGREPTPGLCRYRCLGAFSFSC